MKRLLVYLLSGVTAVSGIGLYGATKPANKAVVDCNQAVKELGECGGSFVRIICYDQEALFGQDEQGNYRCFELQEKVDGLNREFDKRKSDLRERSRLMRERYQDQEMVAQDPRASADMMKEQNALEIDAKVASQEYQMRLAKINELFLRSVQSALRELAEENDWEIIIPYDRKSSYVVTRSDCTEAIIKHLNSNYREQQRAKKEPAKKQTK